jgi:hypothetical protein
LPSSTSIGSLNGEGRRIAWREIQQLDCETPRLSFRISRYGVTRTSLGITLRPIRREGFPDMSRTCLCSSRSTGASVPYPTRNFALGLTRLSRASNISLRDVAPVCRHTDGTISSPVEQGVRRMASEDSDQFASGLSVVHLLCDFRDFDEPFGAEMPATPADLQAPAEAAEVRRFRGAQGMPTEERNNRSEQLFTP